MSGPEPNRAPRSARSAWVLCLGAVLGPIVGFVMLPFAFLGAACALMSIVLASVHVAEHRADPPGIIAAANERSSVNDDAA